VFGCHFGAGLTARESSYACLEFGNDSGSPPPSPVLYGNYLSIAALKAPQINERTQTTLFAGGDRDNQRKEARAKTGERSRHQFVRRDRRSAEDFARRRVRPSGKHDAEQSVHVSNDD
jgi:hypothetical protein